VPVIYAAPFILLSAVCCLTCLVIPKMRRYLLQAAVAPVAFGFCSIISAGAIILISDHAGIHLAVLDRPLDGIRGVMIALAIYITPGMIGTWLAVSFAGRIKMRVSK